MLLGIAVVKDAVWSGCQPIPRGCWRITGSYRPILNSYEIAM